MEILFLLIPLAVLLLAVAAWALWWSVRNRQFEDLERRGYDILWDESDSAEADDDPAQRSP